MTKLISVLSKIPEYLNLLDAIKEWDYGSFHSVLEIATVLGIATDITALIEIKSKFYSSIGYVNRKMLGLQIKKQLIWVRKGNFESGGYIVARPDDFNKLIFRKMRGIKYQTDRAILLSLNTPFEKMTPDGQTKYAQLNEALKNQFNFITKNDQNLSKLMGVKPRVLFSEKRPVHPSLKPATNNNNDKPETWKQFPSDNEGDGSPWIDDVVTIMVGKYKGKIGVISEFTEDATEIIIKIDTGEKVNVPYEDGYISFVNRPLYKKIPTNMGRYIEYSPEEMEVITSTNSPEEAWTAFIKKFPNTPRKYRNVRMRWNKYWNETEGKKRASELFERENPTYIPTPEEINKKVPPPKTVIDTVYTPTPNKKADEVISPPNFIVGAKVRQVKGVSRAYGVGDVVQIKPDGTLVVEFYRNRKVLPPDYFELYTRSNK